MLADPDEYAAAQERALQLVTATVGAYAEDGEEGGEMTDLVTNLMASEPHPILLASCLLGHVMGLMENIERAGGPSPAAYWRQVCAGWVD